MLYYVAKYHPYRGGQNAAFDLFSRRILDLKDGYERGLAYFAERVEPLLQDATVITVVPSHGTNGAHAGIRQLARRLTRGERVDGTGCLVRAVAIPKLSHGGSRCLEVHLNSIVVRQPELLAGRHVTLLDDVMTSGNSLLACERLLREAGAAEVYCLALGRTS